MGVVGKVAKKVGENPVVKATGEATMRAAEAVLDAHDAIDRRAEAIENKIKESAVGQKVQHMLGDDRKMGRVEGKEIDDETSTVAIREETPWERRMRKIRESTFMGPLVQTVETVAEVAGDASDRLGDRVFGENETSVCIAEIKRDDPRFSMPRFLDKLERETIPFVLTAFLENRAEDLHDICTERSLSLLGHIIRDRLQKGHTCDPHILDLEEVQLQEARMVDGEPVLLVTFQTQQLHCVRDKKGEIVEGGESTIQQIFYIWAMVRFFPEDPGSPPVWKLHEMAIQHQMALLT
uniref:Tim44-like domain-containing protein n=2 Tax=Hemiselmis andersenii TaxID=464988 RepID=A0A7S0TQT8_HEMAN|mmetsp:Transcript_18776/g.43283  ORF Transcript_18776/g.43283 Transcript_18776/m.43283 type:complete len:294 (+) Transcript_18776:3-884(+)